MVITMLLAKAFEQRWINVNGVNTRYFDEGKGEPVVLIHGGAIGDPIGASNAEDWSLNFGAVAHTHNAIALDRLGQGYTDNPLTDADYAMSAAVAHVVDFLRQLAKGPYHLVGHSRGGYVACRVTLDHPELVTSCFMIDSATSAPGMERNPFVFATNPHGRANRDAIIFCYRGYAYSTAHMTDDWIDDKLEVMTLEKTQISISKMHDQGLMYGLFWPGLRQDREELHLRLEHQGLLRPTMLFWAARDPTAPLTSGHDFFRMLAHRQPRTQMHVVNLAGHFSHREQPKVFQRVLAEFLESVSLGL
jgi:2-hydroxy-6-oxonona-2,4-dienedioate hydrolase